MKADHVLKHDFVNNVLPDIACNVLDQWLDETGSQFKVIIYYFNNFIWYTYFTFKTFLCIL